MLIDTHAHLYLDQFDADREAALARAREAGVETIVMPAIDPPSIIRLAMSADLPLVIHNREATEDILDILEDERASAEAPEKMRGILHCYVDPPEVADRAWNLGFYVGVGGIMTFSNSEVDDYVREVPLNRIVVETDSPYLAPEPNRGDRNEPAYVRHVATRLAEVKDVSVEEVERITTQNARTIYELDETSGAD